MRACGVNFPDLLMIRDLYQYKPPRPFAPGAEVSGVVDAVGEGVDKVLSTAFWAATALLIVRLFK